MLSLPAYLQKADLVAFCQRSSILKLSLFGSVVRGDDHEESDVDLLVEFLPGTRIGFFELANMEIELSQIIGRKVDLRTAGELSRHFRADVVSSARELYGA